MISDEEVEPVGFNNPLPEEVELSVLALLFVLLLLLLFPGTATVLLLLLLVALTEVGGGYIVMVRLDLSTSGMLVVEGLEYNAELVTRPPFVPPATKDEAFAVLPLTTLLDDA